VIFEILRFLFFGIEAGFFMLNMEKKNSRVLLQLNHSNSYFGEILLFVYITFL